MCRATAREEIADALADGEVAQRGGSPRTVQRPRTCSNSCAAPRASWSRSLALPARRRPDPEACRGRQTQATSASKYSATSLPRRVQQSSGSGACGTARARTWASLATTSSSRSNRGTLNFRKSSCPRSATLFTSVSALQRSTSRSCAAKSQLGRQRHGSSRVRTRSCRWVFLLTEGSRRGLSQRRLVRYLVSDLKGCFILAGASASQERAHVC